MKPERAFKVLLIASVKVDRQKLLTEIFAKNIDTQQSIDLDPIEAGHTRKTRTPMVDKLIFVRTGALSAAPFVMGEPGGIAVGATIPAPGPRTARLYAGQDLRKDGNAVRGQLILY